MPAATDVAGQSRISARQLWIATAWLSAGIILGQFTYRAVDPLWLDYRRAQVLFGHWYDAHKTNTDRALLSFLLTLWLGAPEWGLLAIVGFLRGLFDKERLVLHLLLFGIGFSFFPFVLDFCLYLAFPSAETFGWGMSSVGLLVFAGILTNRLMHRKKNDAPKVNVPE